jgi:hypothetical protein
MNLRGKSHIVGATSEIGEVPFSVELVVGANHSFYSALREAIDDVDPAANEKRTVNR